MAKETDCIGEIILALGGRESTNPEKTFSTPSDNVPQGPRHVPSLLGVEGARGSGGGDAAMLSEPPAKTPRLDSGLLRKHPHPTLAGAAERTSGDSPMRARLAVGGLKRGSDAGSGGLAGRCY